MPPLRVGRRAWADGAAMPIRALRLLALAILVLPVFPGDALADDVVLLSNGGRIRGTVIEADPREGASIKLEDGSVRRFDAGEISTIRYGDPVPPTQEPPRFPASSVPGPPPPRGYGYPSPPGYRSPGPAHPRRAHRERLPRAVASRRRFGWGSLCPPETSMLARGWLTSSGLSSGG